MRRSLTALAVVSMALSACSIQVGSSPSSEGTQPSRTVALRQTKKPPPHSSTAAVIRRVLPSVVNIRVRSVTTGLFGQEEGRGEGSGVVISKDGVIVTNNHVVANATEVTVVLKDGRKLSGRVLGTDPQRDLAVVKVDATDLTPITLGDSNRLELGDPVIAIGFPLDLGGATVTQGIISAKNRTIGVSDPATGGSEHLEGLLQTDAAINPGNSGGALVDMNGSLVGINSAAASAASAENIGFSISIDSAIPVIRQILTEPAKKRAWLGVYLRDLDPALAGELGIPPSTTGAVVVGVIGAGPAAKAGLRRGDVIVSINGSHISSADDVSSELLRYDPGQTVKLGIISSSGRRTESVRLGLRPVQFAPKQ